MALDPTLAIPGTLTVEVGGDERGGGNYPTMDAGKPLTVQWEEIYGVVGGATLADSSGVGAGAETFSIGAHTLKNGLCDIDIDGPQGFKKSTIRVVGCIS